MTSQPEFTQSIIAQFFPDSDSSLRFSGMSVEEIASEFGTPLFVYDAEILTRRLTELRTAFGPDFDIFFSVKANPNQRLLRFFLDNGCGLEIASAGELFQAKHAGCLGSKMIFAGPGKTDAELRYALENNVSEIHVESVTEGRRLNGIATELGKTANVAIRINPAGQVQGGAMRMGGKPLQFGIDEEQLEAAIEELQKLDHLNICGVHLYPGTQILDSETLLAQYEHAVGLATNVAELLGTELTTIDFGGGLGIPYFPRESELDLATVQTGIASLMNSIREHRLLKNARLVVEPGRFLVADAGVYISRVVDVKLSRDKTYVVLDGGMHHHLAASGNLGQTIKRNFPLIAANRLNEPASVSVEVVGPLCTPLDQLGRNTALPPVQVGDLIGVLRSGAYARSASPQGFLSQPAAAEVIVENGACHLIRRRGRPEDYLADQCLESNTRD